MIFRKVMITYFSDNLLKTKNDIINILKEFGLFELELIENFNINSLDYNEEFDNLEDIWAVIFYLPDNKYFDNKVKIIDKNISKLDDIIYEIYNTKLDTDSYKDEWKKSFNTTKLSDNLVINPSWIDYEAKENEIVINIDPSIAFGTGTHETTSLCINLIEKYSNANNMLDIGCGSGILMLVAKKMGVKNVTGIDIDKNCEYVVKENFKNNNIEDFNILIGNLVDKINDKYDLVVSNILVDVLEKLLLDIKKILKNNTIVIFSGILLEKKDKFIIKANEIELTLLEEKVRNKWVGLVFRFEE